MVDQVPRPHPTARVPRVSVLMAVYNERPDFLEVAVRALLEQSMTDFELVLVDDGSDRPDTRQTLERFAERDSRIHLRHEPHRGLTRTLNQGLAWCRAPLVCRQDSDDWSEPQRLDGQVRFLDQHPEVGMIGSFVQLHQEDGTPLWKCPFPERPEEVRESLPRLNPFCHGAICFRRTAAEAVGGYREFLKTSQDYDFVWRLSERFGGANLPEVLYHHRRTAGSISATKCEQQIRDRTLIRVLGRMRGRGQREDLVLAQRQAETDAPAGEGVVLARQAEQMLLAGHYRRALRASLRAVAVAPFSVVAYGKLARCLAFPLAPGLRRRFFRASAVAAVHP